MCEQLIRINTMIAMNNIKKKWLLPLTCLIAGTVFLVMADLRFHIHQNIKIPKYIKTNFDISNAFEDVQLFESQYDSETTQTVFTKQVGKNKSTNDIETALITGKRSS